MRRFTRRYILKLLYMISLYPCFGALFKKFIPIESAQASETQTLSAFLNTLIPSDEVPGAVEFGVDLKVLSKAASESSYKKLIKEGCEWLDAKAIERGVNHFAALNEAEREAVVTLASSGKINSLERIFFIKIRNDAFYYYYSHPQTWRGLRYPGPPQPLGFMDYESPPGLNKK